MWPYIFQWNEWHLSSSLSFLLEIIQVPLTSEIPSCNRYKTVIVGAVTHDATLAPTTTLFQKSRTCNTSSGPTIKSPIVSSSSKKKAMPIFTSSKDTVTEQLLVVEGTPSCCIDRDCSCRRGQQESYVVDDRCCTTKYQDMLWAIINHSTSLESSPSFLRFLRPRFLLVGVLFGSFMELMHVQTIQLGYAKLEQPAADNNNYSVRIDHLTDVFFVELSFLYSDIVFLFYIIVLARSALKKNLSLDLPIMASNWLMGIVLGLLLAITCLFGSKSFSTWEQILQLLVIIVVGIALCFVTYAAAMEMQTSCGGGGDVASRRPPCRSSSRSCQEDKIDQKTWNDASASSSSTSLLEALIV